ncbi:MAG: DUF1674 domain-containing protein [Hyphomonas sp.]|uniref:DUF1674 domain-containing protein n=1 Tax=Hyphomonas sp. TaxID=87 RepID=UPI00183F3840|nr:DUF1674 domain-containing protein [Hyphomonas sp.]MBA3069056.1 DUF1674 domain-containing protein [Hyphomonas sp.]MBU4061690.1 DUF1674 domain-containing protein [Alphaproteobacteria bacterium]MBU4163535.1 DUF1674 domain-containing protein [Alphaproteobacteria bacterium]MBU4568721.1 DUF1674 domain-containing protein [Alphaproteobacteria bacterium]
MTDEAANPAERLSEEEAARRAALPAAARRALEEADRRKKAEAALPAGEQGGPRGIEPTRYGDWERKGITYDF